METRVITAHIPVELAEKVDAAAERLERSRGWIVKKALAAWIADDELRDQLTREALTQARDGHGIDGEDIKAWAASLGSGRPLLFPEL